LTNKTSEQTVTIKVYFDLKDFGKLDVVGYLETLLDRMVDDSKNRGYPLEYNFVE